MDRIGQFTFLRLSGPPLRAHTEWDIVAQPGIDGSALWATGHRGEPFTLVSEAVALNFGLGRLFHVDYQTLINAAPVSIFFGTIEAQMVYKVLDVKQLPGSPKACLRVKVGGDPLWYQCLVTCEWSLLPIDPFTLKP
jgi:hypothetical protein